MSIKLKLNGDRAWLRTLKRYEEQAQEAATPILDEIGASILAQANKRWPVDQGELRASQFNDPTKSDGRGFVFKVVGYRAPHAPYVEESRMNPKRKSRRRYLAKAVRKYRKQYRELLQAALNQLIEQLANDLDKAK